MNIDPQAPNFLIIGAQKCGTSWLHQHLSRHPDIFLPPGKELEFFSYETHLKDPGFEQYLTHFTGRSEAMMGEATASYFWTADNSAWCRQPDAFQQQIPQTIRTYLGPELKIILALRDPVERAISAYAHYLAHGELAPTLDFLEAANTGGIVDMGFYGRHLQRWLEVFPLRQFCIVDLDADIALQPGSTLQRLHLFLGVSEGPPKDLPLKNVVFPGLPRHKSPQRGVEIELPDGRGAKNVSNDTLKTLKVLYAPDRERLRSLVGESFQPDWL